MLKIRSTMASVIMSARIFGFVLAVVLFTGVVSADNKYSANYELELKIEENESTVRTRASFDSGESIVHDFGAYRVQMVISESSPEAYNLTVSVSQSSDAAPILKQNFAGTYGGILEFEAMNQSANVNGAIIVGSFK